MLLANLPELDEADEVSEGPDETAEKTEPGLSAASASLCWEEIVELMDQPVAAGALGFKPRAVASQATSTPLASDSAGCRGVPEVQRARSP